MDYRQLFLSNLAQTSFEPLCLEFISAKGSFLYDKNNEPYLDLISGISVSNVGHRHPKVVEAIKNQVDQYLHLMVYGEYVQAPQVKLATVLINSLSHLTTINNAKIDNVYFTNSGTEAVEGAMKLAKRFTNRPEIVACRNAYHGSSQGALSLGESNYRQNFSPLLPGIRKINRNVFDDLEIINSKTAAVIIEPIGAESGVYATNIEFMQALAQKCKKVGALLIFDEIQTGFGRTGSFWACETFGFAPDIILAAKGMGGGLPIGAFMAPQYIMSCLKENPVLGHITTFGGNPVCCAAALATLNVIQNEIDFDDLNKKSERIKKIFLKMAGVSEVRGKGFLLAAQMESFEVLKNAIDKLISKKIITDWFLYCNNAMRIAPPLNISDEEIDLLEKVVLSLK